jgi:hypothetical protein
MSEPWADDDYGPDDFADDDPSCTWCGGEQWTECDDPIQCTYARCDGEFHPCPACCGAGLGRHQRLW